MLHRKNSYLPRKEKHMYQKPSIMNTSCSSAALRHGHRGAIISGRLMALALFFLVHIPAWFVLTVLPALQQLVNVSASSLGFEPHDSLPHLQGSSSKPLLLVLSLTCKIHKFHLNAKDRIKQMCISSNTISNVCLVLQTLTTLFKVRTSHCTLLKRKLAALLSA